MAQVTQPAPILKELAVEGVGLTRYGLVRSDYFAAMIEPVNDGAFVRYEDAVADRRAWEAEITDLVNQTQRLLADLAAERARANGLADALADARDNGLIYWEPNTERGHVAKAQMLARIDAILSSQPPKTYGRIAGLEAAMGEILDLTHDDGKRMRVVIGEIRDIADAAISKTQPNPAQESAPHP